MKLLFENWREYLNERFGYTYPQRKSKDIDLGETYTTITIDGIVNNKYNSIEDQTNILLVLGLFDKLHKEQDLFEVKSMLKRMRTMSGNSEDFSFLINYVDPSEVEIKRAKEKAREFYILPNKLKARPKDRNFTKSLREWYIHLQNVYSSPISGGSWQDRSEKINAFYPSSDHDDIVDPYTSTLGRTIRVSRKGKK